MFKHVSNPTKIQTFCNVVAAKGIWGLSEIEDGLWRKMFFLMSCSVVVRCCSDSVTLRMVLLYWFKRCSNSVMDSQYVPFTPLTMCNVNFENENVNLYCFNCLYKTYIYCVHSIYINGIYIQDIEK